ncbi:MAG: hypothetical protein INR62_12655, partial [Rhodospirillales bacterium]|nr:hypothetical protein [Acetobacter sp.]
LASSNPALVSISATQITVPAGSTTAQFNYTGVAAGSSLLSASVTGGGTASVQVTATASLISLGAVGKITAGQTVSLPLSLGTQAPPGGLTVHFTSSNPSVATVTSSVFIPAGQTIASTNPQITALTPGTTQITATATNFAPNSEAITVVAIVGTLSPSPVSAHTGLNTAVSLNLTGAAPSGGLTFALTSDNPAIAKVPSSVTVPAGSTSVTFNVTGVANGSTTLRANATGIAEATDTVNVTAAPAITLTSLVIGNNTVAPLSISLSSAPTSNETLTLTSPDPTHFLLSTSATAVGSASITVPLTLGNVNGPTVYLEGRNFSGNVGIKTNLTASASGYSDSSTAETLYPSGFGFSQTSISTTAFSANTSLSVYLAVLNPGTLTYYTYGYALGPQAPAVSLSATSSNTAAGTIVGSPATFPAGNYINSSLAFHPVGAGTTTLTLTEPAGFAAPASGFATQITATVTSSAINLSAPVIGNNTIIPLGISLSAAPPSATTMTLTSSDPTHFLLSTSATAVGTASVTVQLTSGSFAVPTVYIEGQHYSG